jgi:hypothetical protein
LRKIGLFLVILIVIAILPTVASQYEGYQTLETKYFILKATPEKLAMVNPQIIDGMYEFYLSITGVPPPGESKILVIWDRQLDTSATDTAHKIIHIGKNRWDNKDDFYDGLAYELTHIFVYSQKNMRIISPGVGEFHGIGGGWYLFLYTELEKTMGMLSPEGYEKLIKYCEKRLAQYEKEGAKLEELRPYYNGYIFQGMLITYVERYGIDALKRFFILVTSLEIPESVDSWSAFVWLMGVAAKDLNGVYSLFRDKWHFPVKYGFFIVNVSVIGFRGNYTLKIDKESVKLNKENLSLLLPNDTAHLISISPQIVTLSDKERLICKNYSFRIQNSTKITFEYTKQYYLNLEGWWGNWYDAGEEAKISVPNIIYFGNGTRNLVAGFFDEKGNLISKENSTTIKMDSPKTLQVKWEKEYLLQVKSEYGAINGSGWYKAGTETKVSITQAIIDYGNSTRRVFSGWYENEKLLAKEPNLSVLVNGPKTIIAKWETEYEVKVINKEGIESNWYKKGEKVTVSVPSTVVYEGIYVWHFRGWEVKGKIVSASPQHSFEVEEPLTIRTVWEKELNSSLITLIILAAILILSAIVLPKKMHLK